MKLHQINKDLSSPERDKEDIRVKPTLVSPTSKLMFWKPTWNPFTTEVTRRIGACFKITNILLSYSPSHLCSERIPSWFPKHQLGCWRNQRWFDPTVLFVSFRRR